MEIYDIIMIVVLIGATIFGAYKGLAWQVASLGAIIASCFVALRFYAPLADAIETQEPWNIVFALLILYVGTSLVIWIGFRFVHGFIDRLKLREFDRQLGAVFGLAKGILLCAIITVFAMKLLGETVTQSILESRSAYYVAQLLDKAHSVMPDKVHDALHPHIHPVGKQLGNQDHAAGHDFSSSGAPDLVPVEEILQAFDRLDGQRPLR